MSKFRKGDFVVYRPNFGNAPFLVRAKVLRAHRDGSCTVRAFHTLDDCNRPFGGFLGYRYHVPAPLLAVA